ncbi:zf-HC2 domain-containing protein [Paenibacillus sp. TRM 82003]|nr:zf-HC2 domain-containing protein [Paenibacillus sp. TRM 82003]
MNCKEALPLIHEYVDGDLVGDGAVGLRAHLKDCAACTSRLNSYEKTEALVRVLEKPEAPPDLSASIMAALPPNRSRSLARWLRRHPAAATAAAFVIIMLSSMMSLWNQGTQLAVRGDDLEGIQIEGSHVIVPSNTTMTGDLVVENGTVQVDGDVEGNLTVIDGTVALASTAHISGHITEIDRALDWIWFKLNDWFQALSPAPQP